MLLTLKSLYYQTVANPEFILLIENGKVTNIKGNVKKGFLRDFKVFLKKNKIRTGLIIGDKKSTRRISLIFSNEIPSTTHQQLRNLWGTY